MTVIGILISALVGFAAGFLVCAAMVVDFLADRALIDDEGQVLDLSEVDTDS